MDTQYCITEARKGQHLLLREPGPQHLKSGIIKKYEDRRIVRKAPERRGSTADKQRQHPPQAGRYYRYWIVQHDL